MKQKCQRVIAKKMENDLQFLLPYPAGDVSPVASDSGDSGAQCGASWLKEGTTRCSVSLDAVCTSPDW